jgi:hypothetical protein
MTPAALRLQEARTGNAGGAGNGGDAAKTVDTVADALKMAAHERLAALAESAASH